MSISVQCLGDNVNRETCIRWLSHDPIHHLMLLGDLYPPLSDVSEIFLATDDVEIVGVGSLFRGFSIPSVVITDSDLAIQSALLARIHKHVDAEWLTLSTSASSPIFCQFGKRIHAHTEQQMLLRRHVPQHRAKPARLIEKSELSLLDQFYKEHRLEAWTPLMFDMGPYYGVWYNGRLVAAAGTHFVTPFIAQIGNVFTHPEFRGQGFATATTAAVSHHLQQMGIPIISLFVVTDNTSAIQIYERLGFAKEREIVFAHFAPKGNLDS